MHELVPYWCPTCAEHHVETAKPDFKREIHDDRCSAQYRTPPDVGGWRVCHTDFNLFGGPHVIGNARLCTPCWNRQVVRPAQGEARRVLPELLRRLGL